MYIRPLQLFVLWFSSIFASDTVESMHYKLAVGQGECSTTISTIRRGSATLKVAVTADIGSSSLRADSKYTSCYDYNAFKNIFELKPQDSLSSGIEDKKRSRVPSPSFTQSKKKEKPGFFPVPIKERATSITGEADFEDSFTFLIEQLRDTDIWVVFLSHPDKDHINRLSSTLHFVKTHTPNIKLILLAGGEWFNSHSTEDIREIFGVIQTNRDSVMAFFPYEDAKPSTAAIINLLKSTHLIEKNNPQSFNPRKDVNGVDLESYHGTLFHCLTNVYADRIPAFWHFLRIDPVKQELLISHVLDKIYIWSLDHRPVNTNAQSLVWSHAVDDIGWTFVYTGDAESSTFEKIAISLSGARDLIRSIQHSGNLVMLQGMHHGSKENVSPLAMELFCPNVCVFSAGNGAVFAHPSIEVLGYPFREEDIGAFWEKYALKEFGYSFAAFTAPRQGPTGSAQAVSIHLNSPVFMCTNTYGTLRITKDSISAPSSYIQQGYMMYYLLHAYEIKKTALIDSASITIDGLTANQETEEYSAEGFWEQLRGRTLIQNSTDPSIYEDSLLPTYKLKVITKKRKVGPRTEEYLYFYVLKQCDFLS